MDFLKTTFLTSVELCLYDFPHPTEIPPSDARIEVEHIILDEASENRHLITDVQGESLTGRRFERGEKCFVALEDGKAVSYIWGARGVVGVEEIDKAVKPEAKEIYLYDAFTLEPWRGKNLYPSVLRRALEYGEKLGLTRSLIFVEAKNMASRRGVDKAGFIHFQTLYHNRFFVFTRSNLSDPLEGHPTATFVGLEFA
ncbi:MAG: GNAT family N-acetyltransferase [Nitrospinae bacterium]|nr:GNAT family N-acetyltransferase [Nitrospinota bacterium]